jgi:hypothetical protein
MLFSLVLAAIFTLSISLIAIAQNENGEISGTVTDPKGANVPGATVTIRSTKTGFSRTATTNEDGFYIFVNVQPSTYEISVKATGFDEAKITREVSVGGKSEANLTLTIAGQQAVVNVTDTTAIGEVNTSDQSVSEVITSKQLEELPTISRNPYAFVSTLGNVSEADPSGRGAGVSINGQRSASTSILINGGENVDTFTATPGQSVPLDSVDEFRVVQGTFTAEFGRATGGVVNLVTKTGRNNFFGSGYIYNRNSDLSSAGFDANANNVGRQFFNRNDVGFSVGGPIVKNKLLFFNNTEWNIVRSNATLQAWVPTAASIAAANVNTRNFFSGYTLVGTPTGRTTTLAGTGTNSIRFQEVNYTVPSDTGAGSPVDGFQMVNRIDWKPTAKFDLYGVYSLEHNKNLVGSVSNSPYDGFSTGNTDYNQNFQISANYTISPSLFSSTRFTYNRLKNEQPLGAQPDGPTLYLKSSGNSIGGVPIAFPGYLPYSPGSAIPFGGPQNLYNISEELTYLVGGHSFKGGFQYYLIKDNRTFGAFQNSVQILGGNNTQGVDNFVNGVLLQFQGAINPNGRFPGQTLTLPVSQPSFSRNNTYNEFSFFFLDSWKALSKLTLNLGIRYEYYGPQRNSDRSLDSNFYFGSGSTIQERIRNGTVQIAQNSPVGELWQKDTNNWAPSIGFAYDLLGDGTTSIRGGYALRYERNFGNVTFNVIQNPPNYGVISITPADVGGPIAITRNNAGPLAGSSGSVVLPRVSLRHVREDIVNAFAHQWSFSFERRLNQTTTASATYSGTAGRDLYTVENINRSGSGITYLGSTTACPPLAATNRLNCLYTNINTRANNGYSNYSALNVALESSNLFKTGLTITSYYTFAKAKDNLSSTFSESGNNFNLGLLDPFNPSLDYGNADFDVRHRFITNFIWKIPSEKLTSNKVGKAILGGWSVSGIYRMQTGSPFTFYDCSFAVTVCYRLVPTSSVNFKSTGITALADANSFRFINLTGQAPFNIGSTVINENGPYPATMTARNAFRGPGSWNFDMALSRTFSFTERLKMVLRVDADNAFNHANYAVYGGETEINTADYVRVGKFGRRLIRIGARFQF